MRAVGIGLSFTRGGRGIKPLFEVVWIKVADLVYERPLTNFSVVTSSVSGKSLLPRMDDLDFVLKVVMKRLSS